MTIIKIENIISFSSEDPVHVCSNILSNDSTKKWKCQSAGEKSAVVVLQLEKASVISGIDIGNEHSAFIEVLVSRSGTSDDYKVLLVMSSFMTPLESRNSQNVNKVRMFTKDHFSKPECDEKWDRVKIVCTQPFNKHVQYGLSFIKLQTSDKEASSSVAGHIGRFALRPESPDNFSAGSLFGKRNEMKQSEKPTGAAAAIRDAMRESSSPICKPKLLTPSIPSTSKRESLNSFDVKTKGKPRNRDELLYTKDEEESHEKIDKLIEQKLKETEDIKKDNEKITKNMTNNRGPSQTKTDNKNDGTSSNKNDKNVGLDTVTNSNKRKCNDNSNNQQKVKKNCNMKPFAQLLEGVTLVISGIQNPDRANLRTKALSMGAKYKPDWDKTCTHLICAFVNTPKFNQVKGKGKIVKRSWIEDCHSQRKRLPWRRYALDRNDKGDESEDEICEKIENNYQTPVDVRSDIEDDHIEEASDTEERIAQIMANQKKDDSIYDADTDEEVLSYSKN